MILPVLLTWIEKKAETPTFGIEGAKVTSFVAVTAPTSIGQVIQGCRPPVFGCNNMIYFMGIKTERIGHLTIFALVLGSIFNVSAQFRRNISHDI